MFNIQIIQAQIQYWGDVLEEPQSYNDETVGTAPDQLAFWREQLEKAQKKTKSTKYYIEPNPTQPNT